MSLSLGPGFRLGARWNRLGEPVKTRKKRGENGGKMGEIRSKKCEGRELTKDQLEGGAGGGGDRRQHDCSGYGQLDGDAGRKILTQNEANCREFRPILGNF